ncbi:DNA-directed RNA polymerase III subunit RPC10 [Sipha flava]|uniref:DNA-directed RNA polymerase subunit n=1 Tax=Sipha flava TaxID=143950 RepID=A0A8B8FWK0_9HEMI|nr:DNA-directed RNA polymerase III subunit RPC10 [Sipha flava]
MSSKVVNESSMFYMDFCPNCSNILHLDEYMGEVRHKCQVCPYFSPIKNVTLASRSFYKLKEIDSVLGGKAAWENVDSIDVVCNSCNHGRAYFLQVQTRSADEPMTVFYKCCNCGNRWRE